MKKVACLIYPYFSLYEVTALTSTLVLSFGVDIDYIATSKDLIVSEDGLSCQATKTLEQISIDDYSCLILPEMIDFKPALRDKELLTFLAGLNEESILIAAISSAPILLAKAGLLKDKTFTGGIWQNFFDYFDFIPKENFKPLSVLKDQNIVTAIGFAHQEFARTVLTSLNLTEDANKFFREEATYAEEDLVFNLSEEEFENFKSDFDAHLISK